MEMSEELLEFVWPVAGGGYQWIAARSMEQDFARNHIAGRAVDREKSGDRRTDLHTQPRLFLTDGVPLGTRDESARWIYPLRDFRGRLYRRFAATRPDQEGIKKFADAFGLLGEDIGSLVPVKQLGEGREAMGVGEDLGTWLREITLMAEAVELWDLARESNTARLSDLVHWRADSVGVEWPDHRYLPIAGKEHRRSLYQLLEPGEVVKPALFAVQHIVNEQLWKKGRVGPRLVWDEERGELVRRDKPSGLIGAIWMDLLLAVDGKIDYRRCLQCGTPFPVSPKGQRRKFCSDRCRVANHRQLHAEGGKQ